MRLLRLDGLRAIAILVVVVHHNDLFHGGWVGVELFFVLSGFLITGILRRGRTDAAYWSRFYKRRATRILPPVLLLILVLTAIYRPPLHSVLAYTFFLGNFVSFTSWGVFQMSLIWSLAVEEHFYLVFPFAVRYFSRDALIRLLFGILLLEPLVRLLATPFVRDYIRIYFWTCFHLDGLAMGALLAILIEEERARAWLTRSSAWLAVAAASLFGILSWAFPVVFERTANTLLFNGLGYTLVSLASLFSVAFVVLHPEAWLCRTLASPPPRIFGFDQLRLISLPRRHHVSADALDRPELSPRHRAELPHGRACQLAFVPLLRKALHRFGTSRQHLAGTGGGWGIRTPDRTFGPITV